jgi:hypothetical protein
VFSRPIRSECLHVVFPLCVHVCECIHFPNKDIEGSKGACPLIFGAVTGYFYYY